MPDVLMSEYTRRPEASGSATDLEFERKQMALALKRTKAQEDRVTDAYVNEAMDLERYKVEMDRLRAQRRELEQMSQDIDRKVKQGQASRNALSRVVEFCSQVAQGLKHMTFEETQQLLRKALPDPGGTLEKSQGAPTGRGALFVFGRNGRAPDTGTGVLPVESLSSLP